MPIHCDVSLDWGATPAQLSALGTALWGWCLRAAGGSGVYQYLDNQALADLIDGKLPASSRMLWQAGAARIHFDVRDAAFLNSQAAIDSLRRELPVKGIEDIVVNGTSWKAPESKDPNYGCGKERAEKVFDEFSRALKP